MRKIITICILYGVLISVVPAQPAVKFNVLFITVCHVPALVIVYDTKNKMIRLTTAWKFFNDDGFKDAAEQVLRANAPIARMEASTHMLKPQKYLCGVSI